MVAFEIRDAIVAFVNCDAIVAVVAEELLRGDGLVDGHQSLPTSRPISFQLQLQRNSPGMKHVSSNPIWPVSNNPFSSHCPFSSQNSWYAKPAIKHQPKPHKHGYLSEYAPSMENGQKTAGPKKAQVQVNKQPVGQSDEAIGDDVFDGGAYVQYQVHQECLDSFLSVVRIAMCPHVSHDVRVTEARMLTGNIRVLIQEEWR